MFHTTFRLAQKARACSDSYLAVAKALGGIRAYGRDTPIPLTRILELRGLYDALWCLECVLPEEEAERDRLARLLACDYAEGPDGMILALYESKFPGDTRPRNCIAITRRYANGQASLDEFVGAARAAWAAGATAWATAWDAARAARDATRDDGAANQQWQEERFRMMLLTPELYLEECRKRMGT